MKKVVVQKIPRYPMNVRDAFRMLCVGGCECVFKL